MIEAKVTILAKGAYCAITEEKPGHGAGFWDRVGLAFTPAGGDDTLGNMLTKQCGYGTRFLSEVEFYRGWVYMYWPGMQNMEAAA